MNYSDIPKSFLKPQYQIEKTISSSPKSICNLYYPLKEDSPHSEVPDLGGYPFMTATGTMASGTSLSSVPTYQINFLPREGVIPEVETQLQHISNVLNQVIFPKENKVS